MPLAASVVMPTHNRRASLLRTLEALRRQTCPADRFEVVVVADGCTDDTPAAVAAFAASAPFAVRCLAQPQAGPAAARNAGVAAAAAPVIAFLDDDLEPTPAWLGRHLAHHAADGRVVVVGPLSPGRSDRPVWVRWEDERLQQQYRAMLAGRYGATPRQFYTGNSSVRKCWVDAAGGFDARFRRGEDVELAFRLQRLGLHFVFDAAADGLHHAYRTYRSWRAIPWQYGQNDVQLAREQRRAQLIARIGEEFHERQAPLRLLGRLCVGRPPAMAALGLLLDLIIQAGDRLGLDAHASAACSVAWNLRYWQGLCDALGGRRQFLRLCAAPAETAAVIV